MLFQRAITQKPILMIEFPDEVIFHLLLTHCRNLKIIQKFVFLKLLHYILKNESPYLFVQFFRLGLEDLVLLTHGDYEDVL